MYHGARCLAQRFGFFAVRVSEAPSYGQTVMTYDAASPGAIAYLSVAREIANRGGAPINNLNNSSTESA